MKNARLAAARLLLKTEKGAYSDLLLSSDPELDGLDARDRSLAVSLVRGCLERKLTLDYNADLYLRDIKNTPPLVRTALRIGAYQLLFTDRIPPSAAVSQSVEIVKQSGLGKLSGPVNAVLRRIAENGLRLPQDASPVERASVEYSFSPDLVRLLFDAFGEESARSCMSAINGYRGYFIRRNTLRCSDAELEDSLSSEGVRFTRWADPAGCYRIDEGADPAASTAFAKGMFHVQDRASQICAAVVGAKEGELVYDVCAAPGGKSFTMAQDANDKATVLASDIGKNKLRLISEGARRLGLESIRVRAADARELDGAQTADKVLCDVPCSGVGSIPRKPEIRYKTDEDIKRLPEIQLGILSHCSSLVRPGGALIYSTCTLLPRENEDVVGAFLADHPDFSPDPDASPYLEGTNGTRTLRPDTDGCAGFFIARLKRRSE